MLRRVFGPRSDEVSRGWIKMREMLHSLYSSPDFHMAIKCIVIKWAWHVRERRNAHIICIDNPQGKKTTRKTILKRILEKQDFFHLAQDRGWWWALMKTVLFGSEVVFCSMWSFT